MFYWKTLDSLSLRTISQFTFNGIIKIHITDFRNYTNDLQHEQMY